MAPRQPIQHQTDPRSILLSGSGESVTDEGLLAVLVGEAGAKRLNGVLTGGPLPQCLWRLSGDDLVGPGGVGPAAAARLLACVEMSRRAGRSVLDERPLIATPEDVVSLCGPQLRGADREHFWTLALNTKNRLLRIIEVSVGSLSASIVHPRELFKDALKASAASVVLVHNHPSGDPTPSGADIQLTRRLVKAGDVLGVEVLDHVVIGDSGEHASLRDLGLM
ncbi:MAG: DNA repair protein RadC [Coriobacteriia bacterium]|nr:DNA repair protein RadC [Coriobacteriia bacterium]